jgi:hypothetical protein
MFFSPLEKGEYRKGRGKGWELTACLRIDVLRSKGNRMPELTVTPLKADFKGTQE